MCGRRLFPYNSTCRYCILSPALPFVAVPRCLIRRSLHEIQRNLDIFINMILSNASRNLSAIGIHYNCRSPRLYDGAGVNGGTKLFFSLFFWNTTELSFCCFWKNSGFLSAVHTCTIVLGIVLLSHRVDLRSQRLRNQAALSSLSHS